MSDECEQIVAHPPIVSDPSRSAFRIFHALENGNPGTRPNSADDPVVLNPTVDARRPMRRIYGDVLGYRPHGR